MVVIQESKTRNFETRLLACETMFDALPCFRIIFFTNEAHFHLSGFMISTIVLLQWRESLGASPEASAFQKGTCMVCSLKNWDHWPLFLWRKWLNSYSDIWTLPNHDPGLLPESEGMELEDVWFQQDGTTAHTAITTHKTNVSYHIFKFICLPHSTLYF